MVQFRKLTKEEIANLPPKKSPAKSASRWDAVLDAIATGETVAIPVSSAEQLRGYRIGLARVAARQERKMKLDFRVDSDGSLIASLSSEPFRNRNEASPSPRKGRKRTDENVD